MKRRHVIALVALSAVLAGCATPPQTPIALSAGVASLKPAKVGVVMSALPKVDTEFPGASCLLCYAAASVTHQALTRHVQTLPQEDLPQLAASMVRLLRAKGLDAVALESPLDLKKLPDPSTKAPNFAPKDFSSFKTRYGVDKLLVLDITALGVWRNYSAYVPTGDPKAVFKGTGYLVNLGTNALEWYLPVDVQKSADQAWDEAPKFPGLTNAYFQAIEMGKDSFTKPFEQ